jgi:undecaprenyl diphosphate synthase
MKEKIDPSKLPQHIAIIMDGNGRWAKQKGAMRVFGHRNAIKAVRDATEGSAELGIKYLTLYAFSTENWNRPKFEVDALMELLVDTIKKETPTLLKNNVKLSTIGNTESLPPKAQTKLKQAMEATKHNTGLNLILALSYSGRWEIIRAVKAIAEKVRTGSIAHVEAIDEELFSHHLSTEQIPDPELLIRTSGEMRISNFLLWQIAYSELYITPTLWPDFRREHLYEAIIEYQQRERRFGKTSEQIKSEIDL